MIDIEEALALVSQHAIPRKPVSLAIEAAVGLLLAEDVNSDIDSPPYDKSLMDGYAIVAEDSAAGRDRLRVLEEVTAGQVPTQSVITGQATRIMTGAPMPQGANAVVMVEHTETDTADECEYVTIHEQVKSGQNIMRQATSLRDGQVVIPTGRTIRPIEVGLATEVGQTRVQVFPKPKVAVISTGDELVPADQRPTGGQIRNSNGPMLYALAEQAGAVATNLGIARDRVEVLRERITEALDSDIVVLSGGVSAGVKDLVPAVLSDLEVREVFHKVRLKPGKPLWFGVRDDQRGPRLVFGLPGNPVSSLVCFHLFVRAAIGLLSGRQDVSLKECSATLSGPHEQRGARATYWPARLSKVGDGNRVELCDWRGSADLCTLSQATSLAHFPPGDRIFAAGESVQVVEL